MSMIKRLDKKYLNDILDLHKKAIFPVWRKLKKDYNIKEVKEYINLTFKKGKIFGYFEDGKLIACGGVVLDKKHNFGETRHLLVSPRFQGRGIGKKLLRYIESYAKSKVKKLNLDVLIKNKKAVSFYEKLNYKKHAYIMQKNL